MKFTSDVEYPEDFMPGDIIEIDGDKLSYGLVLRVNESEGVVTGIDVQPGEDVVVYRYEFLADPLKDAFVLHNYIVAEEMRLEALKELPLLTKVKGKFLGDIDTRFVFNGLDMVVEDFTSENLTVSSNLSDGEEFIIDIPETAEVYVQDLVWLAR